MTFKSGEVQNDLNIVDLVDPSENEPLKLRGILKFARISGIEIISMLCSIRRQFPEYFGKICFEEVDYCNCPSGTRSERAPLRVGPGTRSRRRGSRPPRLLNNVSLLTVS